MYVTFNFIENKQYYESLKMKPLDTDKVGGLRSIRDLILRLSIYYYIGSAEGHEYPNLQVGDEVNPRCFLR